MLKASFKWGSIDGIGVETDTITRNDYVYSKEGTYLRFTVKDSFGNAIPFSDVFTAMTLQTGEGPVDSIQGTNPGRQFEDWNNTAATNGFYTKLHGNEIEPYVYYGLTQSGRTTTETRTVNFPANTTRAISLSLTTKEGVIGSYTISVEVMQQTTDYATEDNLLGSANYTFGI